MPPTFQAVIWLYSPASNSGKWRFRLGFFTKHVRIRILLVTGIQGGYRSNLDPRTPPLQSHFFRACSLHHIVIIRDFLQLCLVASRISLFFVQNEFGSGEKLVDIEKNNTWAWKNGGERGIFPGKLGKIPWNHQSEPMKNPIFEAPDFLNTIRVFALKMVGKKRHNAFLPNGYFIVISHK